MTTSYRKVTFPAKEYARRLIIPALCLLLLLACGDRISPAPSNPTESVGPPAPSVSHTDALGRELTLPPFPERVVSLFGSFAELWELAGGTLVGVTGDALEEDRVKNSPDALLLGTNKEPNLELILSLEPDLVLLSADIVPQVALSEPLGTAGIPHLYLKVEEFEDYLEALRVLCELTGRPERFTEYGVDLKAEIDVIHETIAAAELRHPLVLLIRAMSTGAKGKADELMAGKMLAELGAEHLVNRYPSLLDELSMEIILRDDPAYIFVLTMGDSDKALEAMHQMMEQNPAWQTLSAVREGRYIVLPKELFHFKPNARWGEAYAWLTEILYPGLL